MHHTLARLEECYASIANIDAAKTVDLAQRTLFEFWRRESVREAALLRDIARDAERATASPPGTRVRVFYRTSPISADALVRSGPTSPLDERSLLTIDTGGKSDEYSHSTPPTINDIAAAAFKSAGHGVLDLEVMLGMRVDNHPGTHSKSGDTLHFCLPGAVDWALDAVLRDVVRASQTLTNTTRK